jgi:hypothetical protein
MSFHDERCLCAECEIGREKQSHDSEVERIANALGLPDWATIEEIVAEIRALQAQAK